MPQLPQMWRQDHQHKSLCHGKKASFKATTMQGCERTPFHLQASYLIYTKKETKRNATASVQSFCDLLIISYRERNDST